MEHIRLCNVIEHNGIAPLHATDSVEDALQTMAANSISSVIIINDFNHPVGIFTEHDALRIVAEGILRTTKLDDVMTRNLFCVNENLFLHDAYTLLEEKGYRHLVVIDDAGHYIGVVSEGDFLRHMGFDNVSQYQFVEDIMSAVPLMIPPHCTIGQAALKMRQRHCDYAIVGHDNRPEGIVRERDIARYFALEESRSESSIDALISKNIHTIERSISLRDAISTIEAHGIHQLIVTDETGLVIGILQRHDVLKAIHGAYFEFLVKTIEQKSSTIETLSHHQELLSIQSELLDSVINTIPDLIWLKDINGTYITCNHMFERLYNAPRSVIVGKNDYDFVSRELADFFRANDRLAMEAKHSRHNEERLVFADGSYDGLFDTIKTPMHDKEGKIIGVLGVARDITLRKRREEELKEKDRELNEAQALAHLGSWSLDLATNTLAWSHECYRIFGIDPETPITYERFLEQVHPDDREKVKQAWKDALEGTPYELDHRIVCNDDVKWVREHARLEHDANGTLTRGLGTVLDITRQKSYESQLEALINYDTLTGFANRSLLLSYLDKSISKALRADTSMALLIFDLDRFKDINDSFGHTVGDTLLQRVASRMQERIRKQDFIARLGGDEFAVVLENLATTDHAAVVAQELIEVISRPFDLENETQIHIGASVGIVIAPEHTQSVQELLQFADTALYRAKNEGRGTFCYYTDDLTRSARSRIDSASQLRRALENGEFVLYYQPQVHLKSGRIIGAEALIRWIDPVRGMISPLEFIPIAEETGIIAPIGAWVIEEACRQGKIWQDRGIHLQISVNVSAHQVRHQNIPKIVESALRQSGYNANKLTLELTESAMMAREEEVVAMLHQLRARGIKLAIDDFGTGYSSYSYLKRFPIDALKIDKSFIDDVPYEKDDTTIVKAIIAMGNALGYEILAEGVEHTEQAEFLKTEGCSHYQGFLKSRPLSAEAFEKLL